MPWKKDEAKIWASNEKFEVLQGILVSRMDIHLARTGVVQKEMDANQKEMKAGQENLKEEIEASKEMIVEMKTGDA
jgi:uncharacterized membrane-anchored protein YhcB (DUF1043 family)